MIVAVKGIPMRSKVPLYRTVKKPSPIPIPVESTTAGRINNSVGIIRLLITVKTGALK